MQRIGEQIKLHIKGKVISIHAKAVSIHQVHYVEMANGVNFQMHIKLGHPIHNIIDIEELGWQIKGQFASHDYEIVDSNGKVLAAAHRKWLSMHGIYYLDIMDDDKVDKLIAAYIVLEHILSGQESTAVSGTYNTSN